VILSEKVFMEIITWRHKSDFHFIPKGKNVTKMDNSARGVNVWNNFKSCYGLRLKTYCTPFKRVLMVLPNFVLHFPTFRFYQPHFLPVLKISNYKNVRLIWGRFLGKSTLLIRCFEWNQPSLFNLNLKWVWPLFLTLPTAAAENAKRLEWNWHDIYRIENSSKEMATIVQRTLPYRLFNRPT